MIDIDQKIELARCSIKEALVRFGDNYWLMMVSRRKGNKNPESSEINLKMYLYQTLRRIIRLRIKMTCLEGFYFTLSPYTTFII